MKILSRGDKNQVDKVKKISITSGRGKCEQSMEQKLGFNYKNHCATTDWAVTDTFPGFEDYRDTVKGWTPRLNSFRVVTEKVFSSKNDLG